MNQKPMFLSLRTLSPAVLIVDFQGTITARSEQVFDEVSRKAAAEGIKRICFNFSGLEGMDGSGLIQFAIFITRMSHKGLTLAGYGLSESMRQVFDLANLGDLIHLYPDEKAALAGLREEKA